MLGIDKQTISDEPRGDDNVDHIAAYTQADMSPDADPLIDDVQVSGFESPLDDDKEHHDLSAIPDLSDEPQLDDPLINNDDDSLHQALNDMHSQF